VTKRLRVEQVPGNTLLRFAYEGGGEVPDDLKGQYTSYAEAKRKLAVWESQNPERNVSPQE
jgi:hypothetical protein